MLENILLFFSKRTPSSETNKRKLTEDALSLLIKEFQNFDKLVSNKKIADFGCGTGLQSIALAKKYNCNVVGIDSNRRTLDIAIKNANELKISQNKISFIESISPEIINSFDIVISQNSFEHFPNPKQVLEEMKSLLNNSGKILITFGPPWFAPYGSHMHFFCKIPWVNILFPEKAVMKTRSHFRNDGATKYEDVESGLNKMTIKKFESIVSSCNLEISNKKYTCVKKLNFLAKIPLLRELFINHVTVILSQKT